MKRLVYVAIYIGFHLSALAMEKPDELQHVPVPRLKFKISENGDIEDAPGSHLIMEYRKFAL
ncbi:MAG: hypothetical protein FJX03_07200 [Alphaproteobacteria bacterium]|nr:hypothetical protein [Alphaproteobacteria bacterium]